MQVAKLALQVWGASAVGAAIGVAKGLIGTLMDWLVICFIGGVMIKMAAGEVCGLLLPAAATFWHHGLHAQKCDQHTKAVYYSMY